MLFAEILLMALPVDMPLILAADFLETAIPIIFFVLWTVGQLLGNGKKKKQQQKQKDARRPRPPQPVDPQAANRAGGGAGPPKREDALRDEVEEFLRRAQGKPPREKVPAERGPSGRQQPKRPKLKEAPPRKPVRQLVPLKPVAAETDMRSEGVAEHVAKHLSTADIVAHSQALGDDVGLADERLESRLHETFDHQLGNLQHREVEVSTSPQNDLAIELVEMLSSPEGMRKLILANEILRRPEW